VESYYPSLNTPAGRAKLAGFYVNTAANNAAARVDINLNGNLITDPSELQSIYENQIGRATYEVGSHDFQVLNTNYNIGLDESKHAPAMNGSKISILVSVSGNVEYFKEDKEPEKRGFMDAVVLIPNHEAQKPNAAKGLKRYLIQSQNFRLVT
jgi:NTF2-related export protein 1/2